MNDAFYELAELFFAYSFLAWLAETAVATFKEKDFKNRGFASGDRKSTRLNSSHRP